MEFCPHEGRLYSVGIHPWKTADVMADRLQALAAVARHEQVVAIGETGLDALRGAPLNVQWDIFNRHIELAEALGKPLIVHMVRTSQQVLKAWRESGRAVAWVIHGMRGKPQVARPLLDAGFYLSFGPRFNPDTAAITPLEQMLIETDDSGQDINQVAEMVARARGLAVPQLLKAVTANASRLFA
jgi:TatD DNase family protein